MNAPSESNEWKADLSSADEIRLYRVDKHVFSETTEFHKIEIIDIAGKGRCLFLNDCARVFTADEYIYHESLVHPSIQRSLTDKLHLNVLLIGDGDGGGVREILRYPEVASLTWVDIDGRVVDACITHLGLISQAAVEDKRLRRVTSDGIFYLQHLEERFDLVLLSVTDPQESGPGLELYSPRIYESVRRVLSPGGVFARSLCALFPGNSRSFERQCRMVGAYFRDVSPYSVGLPAFGIDWAFLIASDTESGLKRWPGLPEGIRFIDQELFERSLWRPRLSDIE